MSARATPSRAVAAIRTIPTSDLAFEAHVRLIAHRVGAATPGALEDRLRLIYPRVRVRARDISGEPPSWYVYRDGHWVAPQEARWWDGPALARVIVDSAGWIVSANEAAASVLGANGEGLVGRHYTDFVIPGTLDDADALRDILLRVGEATSIVQFLAADGTVRACEQHTIVVDGKFECTIRLQRTTDGWGPPIERAGEQIGLVCQPSEDLAFSRYANILLDRMPEPTPSGLAMRVRRIYPNAEVRAISPLAWRAYRDGFSTPPAGRELWWGDRSLPRIEVDLMGLVLSANEAADAFFGVKLQGRHMAELTPPESYEDGRRLFPLVRELGVIESTYRFLAADGRPREVEYHSEVHGERIVSILRPIGSSGAATEGTAFGATATRGAPAG